MPNRRTMASQAQIDAAKAALAAAQGSPEWLARTMSASAIWLNYTRVTAPLNGVIIWRYADTGALIQAGTSSDVQSLPVVKLSQSDLLRLRLPVPEDAVQFIHEGALGQRAGGRRAPLLRVKSFVSRGM